MDTIIDTSQVRELAEYWRKAPEITRQEMLRAVTEIDILVQGELMQDLPRGAGGRHGAGLAGSIHHKEQALADRVIGMTETDKAYANYVEVGTKPHKPPIQPLVDWVEAVLGLRDDEAEGAAHAISWKIFRKGTKPQPVWQDTYKRILPTINSKLQAGLNRIAARLQEQPT